MSQVLYRKYRPATFDDVVGQDQIVNTLRNSLKKGSISHAYLFHGGRGTGKTSVARILASELGTTATDLYEIDAASNRGIDDIRELREAVKTLPFESKYKIYIIDEAHMLTKEAWNALLKTLEEPPAHVLFIMATTEIHKVPETILSRSEIYTFSEPSQSVLAEFVSDAAKKEGYNIDLSAAEMIALQGNGSFRDTLGCLQKVISSSTSKSISINDAQTILGVSSSQSVRDFTQYYISKDSAKALRSFQNALANGGDAKVFMKFVLHILRMALLLKVSKNEKEFVQGQLSIEDFKFVERLVAEHSTDIKSKALLALLTAYGQISASPIPELPVEIAIAEL